MPSLALQAQLRSALAEAERILEDDSNPFAVDTSCCAQSKKKACTASRRLFDTSASKDDVLQYCFLHQLEVRIIQFGGLGKRLLQLDQQRSSDLLSMLANYPLIKCVLLFVYNHATRSLHLFCRAWAVQACESTGLRKHLRRCKVAKV